MSTPVQAQLVRNGAEGGRGSNQYGEKPGGAAGGKPEWAAGTADNFSYNGYRARLTMHGYSIQKDGQHIGWAKTPEEVKGTIDLLTAPGGKTFSNRPKGFAEPGPASGEISELLSGRDDEGCIDDDFDDEGDCLDDEEEALEPGVVRATLVAGIGGGDDGRTVHDDVGVGGGLELPQKEKPGIDELHGLPPGENGPFAKGDEEPEGEGDAASHDVPVASFVDDLRRKMSARRVMPGGDAGKEGEEGAGGPSDDELDQRGVPVPQEPIWGKEEVNYRYASDPERACARCRFFVEPAACRIVMGMILKTDTCDRFEPEREAGAVRATMYSEAEEAQQRDDRGRFAASGGERKPAGPKPWEKKGDEPAPVQGPARPGMMGRGISKDEGRSIFSKAGRDAGYKEAAMGGAVRATLVEAQAPWFARHKNGENIGLSRLIQIQKGMEAVGYESPLGEVSPPGWEGTVKAMKKHKDISNPWALSWYLKGQGYQPHREHVGLLPPEQRDNARDQLTKSGSAVKPEAEGDGSNQYVKKGGAPRGQTSKVDHVTGKITVYGKPVQRMNPDRGGQFGASKPRTRASESDAADREELRERREAEAVRRLARRLKETARRERMTPRREERRGR